MVKVTVAACSLSQLIIKVTNNLISFVVHKSAILRIDIQLSLVYTVHIFTVRNYGTLKLYYRNAKFIILIGLTGSKAKPI